MTEIKAIAHKSLSAKLAAAVLDVGGKLKADAYNKDQGYNYISADKILAVGGQALAEQGIVIIPQVTGQETSLIETPTKKWRWDARLTMLMIVTDGESEILVPWAGWGSDYSVPDKAAYKGLTSGHKYFVMKLLLIGEGNEDGEHESEPTAQVTRQPIRQPARAADPQVDPQPVDDVPVVERPAAVPNGHPSADMMARYNKLNQSALELGLTVEPVDFNTISAVELAEKGKALKARIIQAEAAITSSQPPAGARN